MNGESTDYRGMVIIRYLQRSCALVHVLKDWVNKDTKFPFLKGEGGN